MGHLNRMCDHPDALDEELADADAAQLVDVLDMPFDRCAQFVVAHKRLRRYADSAYNNARWPKGCHPEHPDIHAVKLYIDWDSFPAHNMRPCTDAELEQIVEAGVWGMTLEEVKDRFASWPMAKVAHWLSDEAYRRIGCLHVHLDSGQSDQIHVVSKPIPGSTIGYAYFPDGTCSDHVFQNIDTIRFGLMSLARLFAHEVGHNHGEQHQFNQQSYHHSIMSYSAPPSGLFYGFSTGEPPHSLPRDRSIDSLIEKYGGEPVEDPDEPAPPPPPTPDDRPQIEYSERGIRINGFEYLLTPRPGV